MCFKDHPVSNQVERDLLHSTSPAVLRLAVLRLDDGIERFLPRTCRSSGICSGQIHLHPGYLKIQVPLPKRFVARMQKTQSLRSITRPKALVFARDGIIATKQSSLLPPINAEPVLHHESDLGALGNKQA